MFDEYSSRTTTEQMIITEKSFTWARRKLIFWEQDDQMFLSN